jgi:hypothetical protein
VLEKHLIYESEIRVASTPEITYNKNGRNGRNVRKRKMKRTLKTRGRGRPKSDNPREIVWPTRLSKDEAKIIDRKAKRDGTIRGQWIRETLLEAATA